MLQETFNNYVIATSIASVNLTDELIKDIQSGERRAKVNGKIITLREKELVAYFLDRYSVILQEYTLTDIANNDNIGNQADNRLTREEMKLVLRGINKFSGLGLNSSEDFVLDRVSADVPATLSVTSTTVGNVVTFRLTITTDIELTEDTTFSINDSNSGGTGIGINTDLIITSGNNSGFIDLSFTPVDIETGYTTTFTINPKIGFVMRPTGGVTEIVPGIAANQANLEAILGTRTEFDTEFTLSVTIGSPAAADTTFVVDTTNAFGLGGSSSVNIIILAGNFFGSETINSGLAIFDSYTAVFDLATPPPAGYVIGIGQATVPVSAVALNIVDVAASVLVRTAEITSFTISVTAARNVNTNTTFVVNATNAFGAAVSTDHDVIILAGSNSGSITINSNSALLTGYTAVFTLGAVPDPIFEIGTGQDMVTVSAVSLNAVSVDAAILTRTPETTAYRLTFTTAAPVTSENTIQVLVTNPYGLGGTETVDGVIPNGGNVVIVDISSNSAVGTAFTSTFEFILPLQSGLTQGSITPSLSISAFDIWELDSFSNSTSGLLDLSANVGRPDGLWVSPDGAFLFVAAAINNTIYRYNLSTPYDITSGSYTGQSFNANEASTVRSVAFNPTGTKMFVSEDELLPILNNGGIYEYDLSTAFNVTTAVYSGNVILAETDNDIQDVLFNDDGTKIYVAAGDDKYIDVYTLTTAYDLSTSTGRVRTSFSGDITFGSHLASADFGKDGDRLYIADGIIRILQYNLSTPYDLSTAVLTKTLDSQGFDGGTTSISVRSVKLNSLGNRMYIVDDPITGTENIRQVLI